MKVSLTMRNVPASLFSEYGSTGLAGAEGERTGTLSRFKVILLIFLLGIICPSAIAQVLPRIKQPDSSLKDFTITAGNAFFDQSPGGVCRFDFGDPKSPFNILEGFNAAHIYHTPGDYHLTVHHDGQADVIKTIHVLPDARAQLNVEPTANLFEIVKHLKNDMVVLLQPGATYTVAAGLEVTARNVCFRAAGPGPAPRLVRIAPGKGGGYGIFGVHGLDVSFVGLEFDSDKPLAQFKGKVRYRAITAEAGHLVVDQCTFRNVDDAVLCTPNMRGSLIRWCTFTREVRGCDVYAQGFDLAILGSTLGSSQEEHNIRVSDPNFRNLLLFENDLTNTDGKETLTFRHGENAYVSHNAFHGWLRFGPGPRSDGIPLTPAEVREKHVSHVVFVANQIDQGGWLQVNEGSDDLTAQYNRFLADRKHGAITVAGPSLKNIQLKQNQRVQMDGAWNKPFANIRGVGPQDVVEEGTQNINAPPARPAK